MGQLSQQTHLKETFWASLSAKRAGGSGQRTVTSGPRTEALSSVCTHATPSPAPSRARLILPRSSPVGAPFGFYLTHCSHRSCTFVNFLLPLRNPFLCLIPDRQRQRSSEIVMGVCGHCRATVGPTGKGLTCWPAPRPGSREQRPHTVGSRQTSGEWMTAPLADSWECSLGHVDLVISLCLSFLN